MSGEILQQIRHHRRAEVAESFEAFNHVRECEQVRLVVAGHIAVRFSEK